MNDDIFALATAPGRAAVAVIRLSGAGTRTALRALAADVPRPRVASLRTLRGADGAVRDHALVLWFPGPGSYTGEDSAELHLHGGPGVIDAVTNALIGLGLRLAAPGEFTRRAFENGKLDLAQAEAVADLVEAETAAQASQAIGQLEGRLGRRYETWRAVLIDALARLEAAVDFPDEEVPSDVARQARVALEHLLSDFAAALADAPRGRRVREGYRVAVIGAPNAGKSSLFNALAGRDAAIVAATAGTTRDIIEVPVLLDGYQALLADTAGLRDTGEAVEVEGVRRARAWAAAADLRLWVVDAHASDGAWRAALDLVIEGDICLLNKADMPDGTDADGAREAASLRGAEVVRLSLRDGDGRDVAALLAKRVRDDLTGSDFPAATRARHVAALTQARDHLRRALENLAEPELAAEDTRLAARALAQISGQVGAEDVLGKVFSLFCIGK